MYDFQPKKLLILNILEILKKYSCESHPLSQKDIVDILKNEYGMDAERKSVRRNLMNLKEFGYPIEYSEIPRANTHDKTKEDSCIYTNFYLVPEFNDSELRFLIDGLLFSKYIPQNQCRELVRKLENLSDIHFQSRNRFFSAMPDRQPVNRQLFYTIDTLCEAMAQNRQVSFCYNHFQTDKKQHSVSDGQGKPCRYLFNPYRIAVAHGRYYLIGNYQKYANVANIRLDRITEISIESTPVKPMKQVNGLEHGLDMPKHMAEHIYMFSGESVPVTFCIKKSLLDDVIDWFGTDVTFSEETDDEVTVRVTVNRRAMALWAQQYAVYARILSPKSLADEVRQNIETALKNYEEKKS